ncbi:MAG: Rrf2 family transcriptional regulator [Planctomycetia bacterium]|nr:Rrf2 family transcriptional regulator [Planctomycetia bacterium]
MALFTRKVDYALVVLSYLHHRPEGGCARVIAERFGLKRAFAAKVLKQLCVAGFVRGRRGLKGGYVLSRLADEIRLVELLDAMEEPFHLADCNMPGNDPCELIGTCPVSGAIAEVDRRVRSVLAAVTLGELFREQSCGKTEYGLGLALVRKP